MDTRFSESNVEACLSHASPAPMASAPRPTIVKPPMLMHLRMASKCCCAKETCNALVENDVYDLESSCRSGQETSASSSSWNPVLSMRVSAAGDGDESGEADENSDGDDELGRQFCAICLDTVDDETPMLVLKCKHGFCKGCIGEHASREVKAGRRPWCPLCREFLLDEELKQLGFEEKALRALSSAPVPTVTPAEHVQRLAARDFRRAARLNHLKRCPQCRAIIEKNEGCDHMTCTCGHHFSWTAAETVVPCRKVHWDRSKEGVRKFMGTTCPNCSPIATAKLAAWRASAVCLGVPAAAAAATAGAAGAALVTCVPAVVCGSLAVAYEPVRLLRGRKKKNPFKKSMWCGGQAVCAGAIACAMSASGVDSD